MGSVFLHLLLSCLAPSPSRPTWNPVRRSVTRLRLPERPELFVSSYSALDPLWATYPERSSGLFLASHSPSALRRGVLEPGELLGPLWRTATRPSNPRRDTGRQDMWRRSRLATGLVQLVRPDAAVLCTTAPFPSLPFSRRGRSSPRRRHEPGPSACGLKSATSRGLVSQHTLRFGL